MQLRMLVVVLGACGGGSGGAAHSFELARADGTPIEIPAEITVSCGPLDGDFDPAPSVLAFQLTDQAGMRLALALDEVTVGAPIAFPSSDRANLFVFDRANETSSSESEATGSMTVRSIGSDGDCDGDLIVDFDGVLGSELSDGTDITVTGTFAQPVTGTHD